jgi:hypothetical protein
MEKRDLGKDPATVAGPGERLDGVERGREARSPP